MLFQSCWCNTRNSFLKLKSKVVFRNSYQFYTTNSLFWYFVWFRNRQGGICYAQTISVFMRLVFPSFVSSSPRRSEWSRWRHFVTRFLLTCQVFDLSRALCQSGWHCDKLSLLGYFFEAAFAESRDAICCGSAASKYNCRHPWPVC